MSGFKDLEEEGWGVSELYRDWWFNQEAEWAGVRISPAQVCRFLSISHTNGKGELANTSTVVFHSRSERYKFTTHWLNTSEAKGATRFYAYRQASQSVLKIRWGAIVADDMKIVPFKILISCFYQTGEMRSSDIRDYTHYQYSRATGERLGQVQYTIQGDTYVRVDDDYTDRVIEIFDDKYLETTGYLNFPDDADRVEQPGKGKGIG